MEIVKISSEYITLGQFLKFKGIIENGAMAKIFLLNNKVVINGEQDQRRGRKLYDGYELLINNRTYRIEKE